MAAGLGLLRLSPDDFWTMTPSELAAALSGISGQRMEAGPPRRDVLLDMIARFPDATENDD